MMFFKAVYLDQAHIHYNDVLMSTMTSQITSHTIVHSNFYSGADQRKHQNSASLAFVKGIHRWPMNSPHKGQVTRKLFPFHDVIMIKLIYEHIYISNIIRVLFILPDMKEMNQFSVFVSNLPRRYGCIARRHGHVFRMALHNEGDWRMETWQRARRASCHVSIRQSPSCVMPFWTHAKCLLAFISYLPMWLKAKYIFIKTVYSPRFYGWPYLQAKHADVCSGVLFWTAYTRRPHVLSLPSSSGCEKSDSWRQARSVKTAKKVMNGTTMWSCDTELCTNGVEATKCWVFVAHFSIYSTSRCRCHTGTDIPRLRGHTLQINEVVRTVRHGISCCAPTIHWKCDAQIQNRQIKSPPALWKHLSFQSLGVIVTLNGKSASMLLEPTKNKLKQWRVIEKKCE